MTIEGIIKRIIAEHNKHRHHRTADEHKEHFILVIEAKHKHQHPKYWQEKLEELQENNPKVKEILAKINHHQHHLGDYYLKFGMKIDLNKTSPEAENLRKVMDLIMEGLKSDTDDDKPKIIAVDESKPLNQEISEPENELLQYKGVSNKKRKLRQLYDQDLLEENIIKGIAVSILAETDGNAKIAADVLTTAGLKIIKSMNKEELKELSGALKSAASLPELNYTTQYGEPSR